MVTVKTSRMLTIARHPGGNYAKVEFEDFQQPHWSDQAGGWQRNYRRHYSPWLMVYGYVWCDRIIDETGWIGHSCQHGPPPHRIKVCVIKTATDKDAWTHLEAVVGPRPQRTNNAA